MGSPKPGSMCRPSQLDLRKIGGLTAAQLRALRSEFPRWNILIQPKEIIWIIVRLDRDHAVPSFLISLRYAVLLVATHKVYVNTRLHRGPQFVEQSSNP